MFEYVSRREVAEYKAYCSDVLNRLKMKLENEHDIRTYVTLIGSGAQNMVMRNGKGSFDLDYNLVLTFVPQEYEKSLKRLKNLIQGILDDLVDKRFTHGKDSTSSITYLAHARERKTVVFSFDVALIREKGGQSKLVHDKKKDIFIWNQIRDSGDLDKKVAMIKKGGRWKNVRDDYRELKNMYLKMSDRDHPSFVVYIQAVNQVYHAMRQGN